VLNERQWKGSQRFNARTGIGDARRFVNFIINDTPSLKRKAPASMEDVYRASVKRAFHPKQPFITTGTPHSRALYPRNYAWFYPCLLDPNSIIDLADAEHRVALLVRGLSIILRNGTSLPFPTTFVPLTSRRFAAVNYVRKSSDSLLGVLAGLMH
jgi:hypothetical protein